MISLTELSQEKLVNPDQKTFKNLILILDDLAKMLKTKLNTNQHYVDDFFAFDPIQSQFPQAIPKNGTAQFDEMFAKKIQILDDPNFIREYRNIISHNLNSLIPSDMARVIKSINENSSYMNNIHFGKGNKKEEVLAELKVNLENLKKEIEKQTEAFEAVCLIFFF